MGTIMDIPLELSFHNVDSSDALKAAVRAHVQKLEQFHDHIIGCRVVIELPHKSQKASGNPPDVHIVVRVPGKEIVVSRELNHKGHKKAATVAYAVLDETFLVAQKQLKDYRRVSHGDVKYKNGEPRGAVDETSL
jgi:ribosome-associated translation inhibitor RaiA